MMMMILWREIWYFHSIVLQERKKERKKERPFGAFKKLFSNNLEWNLSYMWLKFWSECHLELPGRITNPWDPSPRHGYTECTPALQPGPLPNTLCRSDVCVSEWDRESLCLSTSSASPSLICWILFIFASHTRIRVLTSLLVETWFDTYTHNCNMAFVLAALVGLIQQAVGWMAQHGTSLTCFTSQCKCQRNNNRLSSNRAGGGVAANRAPFNKQTE